ncbi:hypothetical protein [Olivibacter sp. SDN3]|nr:hypothetical protein [Olivibacter sp. SDN3]
MQKKAVCFLLNDIFLFNADSMVMSGRSLADFDLPMLTYSSPRLDYPGT